MPIQVSWDNPEKTIIRVSLFNAWTWDEFDVMLPKMRYMAAAAGSKPSMIIDSPDGSADQYVPPRTMYKLMELRKLYALVDQIVFVRPGPLMQIILNNLGHIDTQIDTHFHSSPDLDAARNLLSAHEG
jgi:hypothetical protein